MNGSCGTNVFMIFTPEEQIPSITNYTIVSHSSVERERERVFAHGVGEFNYEIICKIECLV